MENKDLTTKTPTYGASFTKPSADTNLMPYFYGGAAAGLGASVFTLAGVGWFMFYLVLVVLACLGIIFVEDAAGKTSNYQDNPPTKEERDKNFNRMAVGIVVLALLIGLVIKAG